MKLILSFFLCFAYINTLATVPVFQHYGFKSGLVNGSVKAVTQDRNGFIWVGTTSGLFKFNGIKFEKISTDSIANIIDVLDLYVDDNNDVWIGTKKNGLLLYSDKKLIKITSNQLEIRTIFEITEDVNHKLWLATDKGILNVSDTYALAKPIIKSLDKLSNIPISAIDLTDQNKLILATSLNDLYIADLLKDTLERFVVSQAQNEYIHDLYLDRNNKLWVATSSQLLIFDLETKNFIDAPDLKGATRVLSLAQRHDKIWVATIGGGIFKIDINSKHTSQYTYSKGTNISLLEKNIMTLFISNNDFLWVGGFSKGLDLLDLGSLKFGYESNIEQSIYCAENSIINSIEIDSKGNVWIGNEYGLIKYNPKNQNCQSVDISISSDEYFSVYSTNIDGDIIWVSTSSGLLKYNKSTKTSSKLNINIQQQTTFFSYKTSDEKLIVGTASGLYEYAIDKGKFSLIDVPDKKFENKSFIKFAANKRKEVYFPTSIGLLYLDKQGELKELEAHRQLFSNKEIIAIQVNEADELLVSVSGDRPLLLEC